MIKHPDPKQLGEEMVYFILQLKPIIQGSQGKNSRRNWSRIHGGTLFIGLLLIACSACLLIAPKTQGWKHHSELGPPISVIKKVHYSLALQIRWGHFLNRILLFTNDCSLCWIDRKPSQYVLSLARGSTS